jgi:hypothetical protein
LRNLGWDVQRIKNYNPFDRNCPIPVVVRLSGGFPHCIGILRGCIIDPSEEYVLELSHSNLDTICGGKGRYRGFNWACTVAVHQKTPKGPPGLVGAVVAGLRECGFHGEAGHLIRSWRKKKQRATTEKKWVGIEMARVLRSTQIEYRAKTNLNQSGLGGSGYLFAVAEMRGHRGKYVVITGDRKLLSAPYHAASVADESGLSEACHGSFRGFSWASTVWEKC